MKTHYRKVFKSDHLGIADLEDILEEGKKMIFTIKSVKQYLLEDGNRNSGVVVAGRRISANIAILKEHSKPLVLNATNSKQVAAFAKSPFVDDWSNQTIELYIDPSVKMKGEVVGGVRIRPVQPKVKPTLTADHARFTEAKAAAKAGKLQGVLNQFQVSDEVLELLQAP